MLRPADRRIALAEYIDRSPVGSERHVVGWPRSGVMALSYVRVCHRCPPALLEPPA